LRPRSLRRPRRGRLASRQAHEVCKLAGGKIVPVDEMTWLEKLVEASARALEHMRGADDPFSRDLVHDLEAFHSDAVRRLNEARLGHSEG
jgi:hypothetical protein